MVRCLSTVLAIIFVCAGVVAQDDTPPVIIERFTVHVTRVKSSRLGIYREPTKITAQIRNVDPARRVKEVEFQFDVIDKLRRVAKERLFIKITDYGLGDRTIDVGKTREWKTEIGSATFPEGCEIMGIVQGDSECLSKAKINVVHFKDGSTWERKGWRDEPNPNR